MHIELAEQHCSRLLQLPNDFGIFGRNALAILIAGCGGAHSGGVEQVFKPERDAVQRAALVSRGDFSFGLSSLVQRAVRP